MRFAKPAPGVTGITNRWPVLRFSLPRWIRPKALAHTAAEPLVALLLVAGLGSVFAVDQVTPRTVSVGSFAALFVVLAAWLLSARATAAVTAIAVVLQGWLGLDSALSGVSAGSNIAVILLMAGVGHLAAANSAESRALRERQLRILLDLANRLNLAADLQGALDDVAGAAARFVAHSGRRPAERGMVWTLGPRGLEVAAESDGPGTRLQGRRLEPSTRLRDILAGRAPEAVRVDALGDELGGALAEAGVESMAVAPILVGGEPFGMLTASGRDARPFAATELELLGGLAQVAGLAIARTRQTDLERRRIQVLEVLNEAMLAAGSAGSADEASGLVAEKVRGLLGAQTGALILHDPDRGGFWVEAATRPLNLVAVEPGRGLLGTALGGTIAGVLDAGPPWQEPADAEVAGDAAHLLAAPIRARGQVLGALVAAGDGFGEHEELLLALLGAQLGPVLDAMRLHGEVVESEQRLRSLCSSLGCGAVIHDPSGRVIDANWAAGELTGRPQADLVSGGIFSRDWTMELEAGVTLPDAMRPPGYVLRFDRPLRGLVARVQAPGGTPRWLRIDSIAFKQRDRLKWVVTTFFETAPPAAPAAPVAPPRRPRRAS
jgi:GAF domain-containing protein